MELDSCITVVPVTVWSSKIFTVGITVLNCLLNGDFVLETFLVKLSITQSETHIWIHIRSQ